MNTRNKITSALTGGLAALVIGCTGGGSDPKPVDPTPTPVITVTGNFTAKNLDNPGSDNTYISGDAMQYTVTAKSTISNYANPNAAVFNFIKLDFNDDATYDQSIAGNSRNDITETLNGNASTVTQDTTRVLRIQTEYMNPINGGNSTQNFNGQTITVKPAEMKTYNTDSNMKTAVNTHVDYLSGAWSPFPSMSGAGIRPQSEWRSNMLLTHDNVDTAGNPEATTFVVDYTTGRVYMDVTQGLRMGVNGTRKFCYEMESFAKNKLPTIALQVIGSYNSDN